MTIKPTVIYHANAFHKILEFLTKHYPKESGGFLLGPIPCTSGLFVIDDVVFPKVVNSTTHSFSMPDSDTLRAYRCAARRNRIVLGDVHSHPWKEPHAGMVHQSHADAAFQELLHLPISLVIGFTEDLHWVSATWAMGYSAPVSELIRRGYRGKPQAFGTFTHKQPSKSLLWKMF